MRFSEKWGVDVETAVGLALKDLKLERDEVEVEVLEESSSGFLGIGSKLAKVRVTAKEEISNSVKEKATFDDIDAILAGLPENTSSKLPDEVRAEYDKYEAEEREDARRREKALARERENRTQMRLDLVSGKESDVLVETARPPISPDRTAVKLEVEEKQGIGIAVMDRSNEVVKKDEQ